MSERREIQEIHFEMGEQEELSGLQDVCWCLCIAAECGAHPVAYVRAPPEWVPCMERKHVSTWFRRDAKGKRDKPHVLDPNISTWVAGLRALPADVRGALRIALHRLSEAWAHDEPHGYVDPVIDLAIALEVLFVGASETSGAHKVAVRASRLLGADPRSRRRTAGLIEGYYAMRNEAVHRGRLRRVYKLPGQPDGLEVWSLLREVRGLAAKAAAKWIENGAWIDWRAIESG